MSESKKPIDYRKIVREFNPKLSLLKGFDRHILDVKFNQNVNVFYSLWGITMQLMLNEGLNYTDSFNKIVKQVKENNENLDSVVFYFLYDDLPKPELN